MQLNGVKGSAGVVTLDGLNAGDENDPREEIGRNFVVRKIFGALKIGKSSCSYPLSISSYPRNRMNFSLKPKVIIDLSFTR
jgi:hypothetical protein